VQRWNSELFSPRGIQAVLCYEYLAGYPHSSGFAMYLVNLYPPGLNLEERFDLVSEGLERIDIFDPPDMSGMTSDRPSIFSKQPRARGRVHVGRSLRALGEDTNPVTLARASSPLTTITEVSERSSRSRPFPPGIPVSARTHPEQVVSPVEQVVLSPTERSRSSSRSTERRSRWSRSPPHSERLVPNDGEASDARPAEPSNLSPLLEPTSITISPIRQSHDAEIRQWTQSQAMYANNGSQQPGVYGSFAGDVRPGDQHAIFVDRERRPHVDDRSRHHRGEQPIIHARTDPRVSRNDSSSSRRRSTSQPSRHSHRHHSIPVGFSTRLPSDSSFRKSTGSMASDAQRSHRSKATTSHGSLPRSPSYHGEQAYPTVNGVATASTSPRPLPTLPTISESQDVDWDGIYGPPMTNPPVLSPLPIKPMSIDLDEDFTTRNDVGDNKQCSHGVQPPIGQSSSEHELGHEDTLEGPWKRDVDSLQFIAGNR
jgi:hypothetical protein